MIANVIVIRKDSLNQEYILIEKGIIDSPFRHKLIRRTVECQGHHPRPIRIFKSDESCICTSKAFPQILYPLAEYFMLRLDPPKIRMLTSGG
jgi:hypothetical protein